ncbi:MAG: helix-turn-helix domain-containing protein [Clostridia bacterium]|nr:helix-turn-helix domain-containing protein [Clostridia bacterium]
MAISYKRLWKLLIDKDLKKKDLIKKAGISNYTLNKLNKGETVTSETLANKIRSINHPFISNLITSREIMLMYGKEASNRKQEIDRQHYTIPNQRPKDKHCGKI